MTPQPKAASASAGKAPSGANPAMASRARPNIAAALPARRIIPDQRPGVPSPEGRRTAGIARPQRRCAASMTGVMMMSSRYTGRNHSCNATSQPACASSAALTPAMLATAMAATATATYTAVGHSSRMARSRTQSAISASHHAPEIPPVTYTRVAQPGDTDYSQVRSLFKLAGDMQHGLPLGQAVEAFERIWSARHPYPAWVAALGNAGAAAAAAVGVWRSGRRLGPDPGPARRRGPQSVTAGQPGG
jgi:Putative threonine/serine exporter